MLYIDVLPLSFQRERVGADEEDHVEELLCKLETIYAIPAAKQRVNVLADGQHLAPGHKLREYSLHGKTLVLGMMLPDKPHGPAPEVLSCQKKMGKPMRRSKETAAKQLRLKPLPRKPVGNAPRRCDIETGEGKDAKVQVVVSAEQLAPPKRAVQASASAERLGLSQTAVVQVAKAQQPVGASLPQGPGTPTAAAAAAAAATPACSAKIDPALPAPAAKATGSAKNLPLVPGHAAAARPAQRQGGNQTAAPLGASLSWSPPLTGQAPGANTPKAPQPPPCFEPSPPATSRLGAPPLAAPGAPTMNVAMLSANGSQTHGPTGLGVPPPTKATPGITRIRRTDLQRIGRLGVGAFGLVTLEADRRTGRTYALKAVSKGYLAHLRMEYSVLNEKRILKMLDTPFVVRLLATYNGREHVYFLLEAALGGELFTTYERLKLYGKEVHARFYVACVTEAIAHMHEHNVIYRDLKPENLLLDVRGFCKVTDMGLAKITTSRTFTMVGTPDYMAPEVINNTGHTKFVDWWTLGVLLFELLAGNAPFESKTGNAQETYSLVKKGIEMVRFPRGFPQEAQVLVRQLCHRVPEARMCTPKLRNERFFKKFDWPALCAQHMQPPLIPQVRGPRDLTNFRDCENEDPQAMPYQDTGSGWDQGFEDDMLSSGASAAAAAAPLLPLPTGGPAASSGPGRGVAAGAPATGPAPQLCSQQAPANFAVAAVGSTMPSAGSMQMHVHHNAQPPHLQHRLGGSPHSSPRDFMASSTSTSRLQQAGQNGATRVWPAHSDRTMSHTGSFIPPIRGTSPPSSPTKLVACGA